MDWAFLDHQVPFGFAHQGGNDVAPGNTDASFAHAVSVGYRYIESDVQATSDGVLVMFHDEDLEPRTGKSGRLEDLTWAEVAELRVSGVHPIPRFDDVVQRYADIRFNIEPKADTAVEPLIDAIVNLDLLDRILVGSFDDARVRKVSQALGPGLATSPGPFGIAKLLIRALFRPDSSVQYAAVQIPTKVSFLPLTSSWLIGRFHRLGLQVHVWTVNDETEIVNLLDRGVDAIMTDRTELLRDVLQSRGQWPEDDDGPDRPAG
ncbi:MAG: glycerophosphodiester phosphodiesterase family protein, partial [Acidimicrobiia bacterium]|nr:glycerophosphodiester phosphodiesterase family protein [Acidimicrobiia bacterium]